ncbi:hypothetical protein AAG570_008650 [Ranatra chinensis]|uniref:BTB domain-containing protein n=1 Tax=Ranatra chinensis TaxID=642074 RepID=A0ABD0YRK2_9HEMI
MSSNHHMGVTALPTGEIEHTKFLSENIGALYLSEEYSDVVLKIEGEYFHSHKVILAARSDYFRALLFGGLKESLQSEIEMRGTNVAAFKVLLKYIYTGQMSLASLKEDAILDILGLAHQYGFEDLEAAICDYLRQSLTVQNVCLIYNAARLYQLKFLSKVCKTFIDDNGPSIISTPGFLQLSPSCLRELIEQDTFFVPEGDIFKAVVNWAQTNSMEGTPQLREVLSAVRFSLMTPTELFSLVRPTGFVTSDVILDSLQLQTISRSSLLPYRGMLKPNKNWSDPFLGTEVLQGEMRAALLDGNHFIYDMERGYTRHRINDAGDHGIVIKLGTQALVNNMRMLLWDRDVRSYSYYIEVSMDQKDWVRVIDHTAYYCRSWQNLFFEPRVVQYIKLVGTNNTVNKVFHVVAFEVMYSTENMRLVKGLIEPKHNVATTKESACVIEGVSRSRDALLDGNTKCYDWDSGYTCHQLGSGFILVQLGQPYMLESMRLLLWDCDDRSYSYYVQVSVNMSDWETVWDKTHQNCRSWQLIVFPMRPVVFIKIIGTHNTANEVRNYFLHFIFLILAL